MNMKSPCSQIRLAHTNSSTRTFYTQAANPQESQLQRTYLHFLLEAKLWHFRSFESKCILFFKSFGKTQQSFLSFKKEFVFSVAIRHFLFFKQNMSRLSRPPAVSFHSRICIYRRRSIYF